MPTTLEAVDLFIEAGILFAPGKASNAGGVAVERSGDVAERHASAMDRW